MRATLSDTSQRAACPDAPHVLFADVNLVYGHGSDTLCALEGLDIHVDAGEPVSIIGPSGCGKSSMLLMAAGLLLPSSGAVSIDGIPVTAPRRDTALILQDFGLLPWKTVRKNAELGLSIRHLDRDEIASRTDAALEEVGLSEFASSYPKNLSGGMRQRLALARAIALDADLLLMDEPLSALDALLRESLQDTLLDLWNEQGYAQILVTHSIEEAVFLGRRIIVLSPRPGRVVGVVENPEMGSREYRSTEGFLQRSSEVRHLLASGMHESEKRGDAA